MASHIVIQMPVRTEHQCFFNSVINVGHVHFFQHFLYEWTINVSSVKQAFINAALYPDVFNIDTTQMKVFGYWDLGINAFNR